MKNIKHISIISVLLLLFLVVIFFATSSIGVEVDYTFNNIEVKDSQDYKQDVLLGTVNVKNDGLLPKRIELDRLILCEYYTGTVPESYYVNYKGKDIEGYSSIFAYNRINYVEVSSKSEVKLDIAPSFSRYNFYDKDGKSKYKGQTLQFYLFKMRPDDNRYDYCSAVSKEDAYKVIDVTFS